MLQLLFIYLLFVKIKEKLSFSIIINNMMIILYMGKVWINSIGKRYYLKYDEYFTINLEFMF